MTLLLSITSTWLIIVGIVLLLRGRALNNQWELEDHTDFTGDESCICGRYYECNKAGMWQCPAVNDPLDPQPVECYSCGRLLRDWDDPHIMACDR